MRIEGEEGKELQLSIEQLVARFGEQHRLLVESAIGFLVENEPTWGLESPIDRVKYIADLLGKTVSME